MKHSILLFILIGTLLQPSLAKADPRFLEFSPQQATSLDWDLTSNGMHVIQYDLDQNGKADFYALRIVKRSFFSKMPVEKERADWRGHLIFSVNHGSVSYYYITAKHPLLYAIDLDEDGSWDLVFNDVLEDGLNGNERFYDSPSGLLASGVNNFSLDHILLQICACQKPQKESCLLRTIPGS